MAKNVTIAVDAMGGDSAPQMVIDGLAEARILYPEVKFLIFGDEKHIGSMVAAHAALAASSEIIHTEDIVSSDAKPSQALRRGRNSSMGLAIQAVKDAQADVCVSAGNTGALMALSMFILRTMPGIDRPALASPVPTLRGESVMLDLGANVESNANSLLQFAIMGAAYARTVFGLSKPSVALLNVGVEDLKGRDSIKAAANMIRSATHVPMKFIGFVEGDGITAGEVDVIVTDGFTGNVALKTMEGTAKFIGSLLERAFRSSLSTKLGYVFSKQGINSLRDHLDPNNHNGGVFLGLNGVVVKSHGGANAAGFSTAVSTAVDMVDNSLIELISDNLPDESVDAAS